MSAVLKKSTGSERVRERGVNIKGKKEEERKTKKHTKKNEHIESTVYLEHERQK